MGLLRTAVTIRNPADRTRSWQGNFLVDTGGNRHVRTETAA